GALVTKALIALNVLVFLVNLAQGSSLNQVSGSLFVRWALYIPGGLDQGEWYRLITAAFLHASLIHLAMNMLILWIVGAPVEQAIARGLGRSAPLEPERNHRRRLRCDLRNPRCRPRPRGAAQLRARRAGLRTDRFQPDHHVRVLELHLGWRPRRRA